MGWSYNFHVAARTRKGTVGGPSWSDRPVDSGRLADHGPGPETLIQEPPVPRYFDANATRDAVKQATDLVALAGSFGLQLQRSGSKYKALCPFHDDRNPSLTFDPERQTYRCWACGASGDVFTLVQNLERVDFPEALRMLAERAGIALDPTARRSTPAGPSKSDLLAVCEWAERLFQEALADSELARDYLASREISVESAQRFGIGFAPEERDWLSKLARRDGRDRQSLEGAGLVATAERSGHRYDRFRGRLIFPIRDLNGRTIAFGGRILPTFEEAGAASGRRLAKYVNSPETTLFQKRRHLYAADLARTDARQEGWVAVVEGYTDVIAAHQVGLTNVVGTLGTALGDDHVATLRRLADRAVLVFDGDEAGQRAAERALELFLGHDLDVRILNLPEGLDPCDFLLREGADPFRAMVEQAVEPLDFIIERAAQKFDFEDIEEARQASEWVLAILAKSPRISQVGVTVKVGQALNNLAARLHLPLKDQTLADRLRQLLRARARSTGRSRWRSAAPSPSAGPAPPSFEPIRAADLDPLDREIARIILNEPSLLPHLVTRVSPAGLRDAPLRTILQTCYDLYAENPETLSQQVLTRLDEPERSLAAGLLSPFDPAPLSDRAQPAPWEERLINTLDAFEARQWRDRLRDLEMALEEVDASAHPEEHQALRLELFRLKQQRPEARRAPRPDPSSV